MTAFTPCPHCDAPVMTDGACPHCDRPSLPASTLLRSSAAAALLGLTLAGCGQSELLYGVPATGDTTEETGDTGETGETGDEE